MASAGTKVHANILIYYAFHLFRYLVPLFAFPYLARILGPEGYAAVLLVFSVNVISVAVLDFGFQFSATRAIASTNDNDERSIIVSNVVGAKLVLIPFALLVFSLICLLYPAIRNQPSLALAAAILFLAQGLSLAWYFQGIEKANLAVLFEASSQIIYFCGLIIFVRSKADYVVAVYTQAAANWLSLLAAFLVLGWRERIISPTRYGIWDQMVASSTFFWLRAGQLVYGGAVPLILGYLSTSRELAYFGIADKFLVLIVALMNPLSQALVPFFSRHTTERGFLPLPTILLILFATVTLCCAFCTAVAFEAENIVHLVFGQDFIQSVPALKLFCICGPLVVSSIVISQFVLIPLRMERYVIMTALPSGALSILVTIFLVPPYGAIGAATARLITELLIASVLAVVFIKRATGHHQLWSSRRS